MSKKTKKYALTVEDLFITTKPLTIRNLSRAELNKKIKEFLNYLIESGVKFTITEDWN